MNIPNPDMDLQALSTYLHRLIADAQSETGAHSANYNAMIKVTEAVSHLTDSVRNGNEDLSVFWSSLLSQCGGRSMEYISQPAPLVISLGGGVPQKIQQPDEKLTQLWTASGTVVKLGKLLGQGGEGAVYKVPAMPGKVVKVFHQQNRRQQMHEKIRLLAKYRDAMYLDGILIAAMPEEVLYDSRGNFAGYMMPQLMSTMKLYDVQREGGRRKMLPDMDYRGLIIIAYNLAEAVQHLHDRGIVIGDMNPNNIVVNPDGTVVLIDCDSFDITDPDTGIHYPCRVGLAELLAPELQLVGKLENGSFTRESDVFSLAIHIFRLLSNNADPFFAAMDIMSCSAPISEVITVRNQLILNGECPYVRDIPGKQRPHWAPSLDIFPENMQALMRRAFDYTADTYESKIGDRPSAREWQQALMQFYQTAMTRCTKDPFHWYLPGLAACPFCPPKMTSERKNKLMDTATRTFDRLVRSVTQLWDCEL